jgi:general secretion pathway protein E
MPHPSSADEAPRSADRSSAGTRPAPRPAGPWIEVKLPSGRRTIRLRRRPLTIGRSPDNVFVIKDSSLSRLHCVIEPAAPGLWRIRDRGSRNGTLVNGESANDHLLRDGDLIRAGTVELRFVDRSSPSTGSPSAASPSKASAPGPARGEDPAVDVPLAAGERDAPAAAGGASPDETDYDLDPLRLANDPSIDPLAGFDPLDAAFVPPAERKERAGSFGDPPGGLDFAARMQAVIAPTPAIGFEEGDVELMDAAGDTMHGTEQARERTEARFAGIRALRLMLYACFRARATDLHLEDRGDDAALLRLRVDGVMIPPIEVEHSVARRVLSIVRVLCRLDNTRKKAVLDGHFSARVRGRRVDFRASFTPAMRGEKLVVRVLDASAAPSHLNQLHLVPWMEEKLRRAVRRDAGLILAAGPTGSGKTTTLYSLLREIDCDHRNVITIEDPVEYSVRGVTQIPVDHEHGHGFATILRSVLRQDPDVILVGEIRDYETAATVMQASMTGHLVFSTVHARDTIGSVFRLLDLGVEQYLVANSLNLVLAQRLVRCLCPHCRRPVPPTSAQVMRMGRAGNVDRINQPMGCRRCLATGYHGRRAVVELLEVGDDMRDVILKEPSIGAMRRIAGGQLFTSLDAAGWQLVADGVTSVEEIERLASD